MSHLCVTDFFLQFCNPLRSAPCPHDISWKNLKMTWILSPPNRNKILGMKMHLHISSHTKGDLHCYADLDCAALNLNLSTSLNQVEAKRHIDLLYKGNQAFLQLLGSRFWETHSHKSDRSSAGLVTKLYFFPQDCHFMGLTPPWDTGRVPHSEWVQILRTQRTEDVIGPSN